MSIVKERIQGYVDREVIDRARACAESSGTSLSFIIEQSIRAYIGMSHFGLEGGWPLDRKPDVPETNDE